MKNENILGNIFDIYLKYLRKSREDEEYEKSNIGFKTLERHNERLKLLEKATNRIVLEENIYREVVSGDSIAERPEIQRLLKDIENPHVKGAWVIDVQRLCRGDLGDQDRIIKAFKYTNTLILTPEKEYDLSNPADEEYLIDKLSYSRKEYNNIKKRLLAGRVDSVMNGCFLGNAPFGYERVKIKGEKGWTLKIVEEQADIVKTMFKLALDGKGTCEIENELNRMNIPSPTGKEWKRENIKHTLKNISYIGWVKYQQRKTTIVMENGILKTKRIHQKEYMKFQGRHPAIIDIEDFNLVQEKLKDKADKYTQDTTELKNPLAGLLRCEKCGLVLNRHTVKDERIKPQVRCPNYKKCGMVSNNLEEIENIILESLEDWKEKQTQFLKEYEKSETTLLNTITDRISLIDKELEKENMKVNRIRSFLEDGTYDKETYNIRIAPVLENIVKLEDSKNELIKNDEQVKIEKIKSLIPKIESCTKKYFALTVVEKNELLKSILEKVTYSKTKVRKDSDLTITIYPKI